MTPDQHRAEAEGLLEESRTYSPAHPMRADILARATVHALLALGSMEARTPTVTVHPAHAGGEGVPAKPAPRKRTARKTTESKGDSK
jgi:hypothetical protein